MGDVDDKFLNKDLYRKIRQEIFQKNKINSAYRSMQIVNEYKKQGGKIKSGGIKKLDNWLKEEWVNVYEYIKNKKIVKCGDKKVKERSACRPMKRLNKNTSITLSEVIDKYDANKIIKAIEDKRITGKRINWTRL